jgi:cytochrome c oxidase subunit 3
VADTEALASHHPALAHQFDDLDQQHDAASLGMWVFLLTEILFFGGLFLAYLLYRLWFPEAFRVASSHLEIGWGAANTVVLILSSLTMALAVRAAQTGQQRATVWFIVATIGLGAVFLGIKAVEYAAKFEHHLVPGPQFRIDGADPTHAQIFFSLYFVMTGLHALHMIIGIGIMAVLAVMAARGRFGAAYNSPVEMGGLYWHFVDIVWIFLFPLLYLIGRH